MTNQEALDNLTKRGAYLDRRIADLILECRPTHFLERDKEAISLAVAALEYTIQMIEYEASQKSV